MALIAGKLALAGGLQTGRGVVNAAIKGLVAGGGSGAGGAITYSGDGAVLGDPEAGQMESGIGLTFAREGRDKGFADGGFTWLGDSFQRSIVQTFTFAWQWSGNRRTVSASPAGDEFQLASPAVGMTADLGVEALVRCCGLSGASNATPGWLYDPDVTQYATFKIWDSGQAWVLMDCVGSLSFALVPGEIPIVTATLSGLVESHTVEDFPEFDYEELASVSPLSIESLNPIWGGTTVRGWSELTLDINNQVEQIPDSSAVGGERPEPTGRDVTVNMSMFDDTDPGIEFAWENLISTVQPTDKLTFDTGQTAGSSPAINYAFDVAGLQITDALTPDRVGIGHSTTVTARASGVSDGGELSIEMR